MKDSILKLSSSRIKEIAFDLCQANDEDPTGYLDYSDLRRGKQRWEYFTKSAEIQHREEVQELLVKSVMKTNPPSMENVVRKTVELLEGGCP